MDIQSAFEAAVINIARPVRYTGYRWVTEIQYIWNAYFLALTIPVVEAAELKQVISIRKVGFLWRIETA
jgi:hypothetical protein